MDYLPLAVRLKDQAVLLVGGGQIALRKASLLVRAGALVSVVAPTIEAELAQMIDAYGGRLLRRPFEESDIADQRLVVVATDDAVINQRVAQLAQARGLYVNVVDHPDASNVIFPAIIDRSPLLIAISSAGTSPVLVRLLRARIESSIPAAYGRLAVLAGELRQQVKEHLRPITQRRRFWEHLLQGRFAELVWAGQEDAARLYAQEQLSAADSLPASGEVYLVVAGPGDPDLLTFKALRLMQQADVIVYDRLVGAGILDLCRRDAERIYVGKARSNHTLPQEDINTVLAERARRGQRVCRLKGGDPFIFGRGGEEIEHLMEQGIPFQVVPGITAASGCAAYAGIPLTHRDHAQSVRFVAGFLRDGRVDLPWAELVQEGQTLVLYMALVSLPLIAAQLLAHGMRPSMPVALIARGTQRGQTVVTGTLDTVEHILQQPGLTAPTLAIVGDVVLLRERLHWYSS